MSSSGSYRFSGPVYGLLAALLFGISTPFAKLLLDQCGALMLAALLYLGSGLGLGLWQALTRTRLGGAGGEAPLGRGDWPWLGLAILFGGVAGPILLLIGLSQVEASTGSLLLNLEGVFTAVLAWVIFRENVDRKIILGMLAILAGAALLGGPIGGLTWSPGVLWIAAACLAWGLDNNLTRRVSAADPVQSACLKGVVAGGVNLLLAFAFGESFPGLWTVAAALLLGFLCYGLSLTCFILALRHLGTARTGAYFSTAPFVGAALSMLIFSELPGPWFWLAGILMAFGVWCHLSEHHEHEHTHEPMDHSHEHVHDEHHQHSHGPDDPPGEPHTHPHHHTPLTHTHPHHPDIHHRH